MRCYINYKNGPFTGTLDIGVENEKDKARIDKAIAGLKRVHPKIEIVSIVFW